MTSVEKELTGSPALWSWSTRISVQSRQWTVFKPTSVNSFIFVYFWTLNAHHGKHVISPESTGSRSTTFGASAAETKRNIWQWWKTLNSWSVQVGVLFLFIVFLCVKNQIQESSLWQHRSDDTPISHAAKGMAKLVSKTVALSGTRSSPVYNCKGPSHKRCVYNQHVF